LADPANRNNVKQFGYGTEIITKGNSAWEGWGTALKPAHEPIVMARKPFKGNVAQNVLEWGTGGINIDDSRIVIHHEDHIMKYPNYSNGEYKSKYENGSSYTHGTQVQINPEGRFPANVIFDEEAGKLLDQQSGVSKSTGGRNGNERFGLNGIYGKYNVEVKDGNPGFGDVGGASRFFYCPKASKKDRNEGLDSFEKKLQSNANFRPNHLEAAKNGDSGKPHGRYTPTQNNHPTIKPTDLMRYLIRLVTPSGGITLDPFMGSGSTGKAALKAGFSFIGIDREKEYFEIAKARLEHQQKKNKGKQINLFD
jgi:site-specific DNA-methyltransferase (adenine-specific)